MRAFLPLLPVLLLGAGCATQTDLAPDAVRAATPLIAEVRVLDHRAQWPKQLATVDGPDGKPLKYAFVLPSVADGVNDAVRAALSARNELAPPGEGRYDMEVTIVDLAAEQVVERQAQADLLIRVVDRRTHRTAYSTRVATDLRGGNYLAQDNALFGDTAPLAQDARAALANAIDRTLDRGGFLLALR